VILLGTIAAVVAAVASVIGVVFLIDAAWKARGRVAVSNARIGFSEFTGDSCGRCTAAASVTNLSSADEELLDLMIVFEDGHQYGVATGNVGPLRRNVSYSLTGRVGAPSMKPGESRKCVMRLEFANAKAQSLPLVLRCERPT
jgi:hypothetical protein